MSKTLKQFKEQYDDNSIFEQLVQEVMSKDADAGAWIKDFVHSDNPKFAGKSKEQRKKMALGAYYAKQKNEEVESESLIESIETINEVSLGAKIKAYAHHSSSSFDHGDMGNDAEAEHHQARADKIHAHILKHHGTEAAAHAEKAASAAIFGNGKSKSHGDSLSGGLRGMHSKSVTKSGKIPKNTQSAMKNSAKGSYGARVVGPKGHLPEEVEQVEEGWDDMVKAAKDSVKSGPKPSGGSGVKQGTRYGGGKQTSKPEQEEDKEEPKKKVNEGKHPEDDSVPFAPPYNTTSSPEFVKDKSGAVHTPMSRAKNLAQLAMKKMRKELGQKGK